MNREKTSLNNLSVFRKVLVVLLLLVMTVAFSVPSMAYAEVMDTSSGIDAASMSDSEFRQYLVDQGFPDSYVTPLMSLHKSHPSWVFQAANTGLSFESVITKESQPGINVVASSLPVSYRSKASGCYDPSSGLYISYDSGGWYTATPEVIRYYMDPRNFFDDYGIFQFMTHSFDSSTQTKAGLTNMVSTTFLRNAYPKVSGESTTFATYSDAIYQAGKISGVNPYVIASIIIVEQGANGGGACISGTEPGYENIFNFFNIEAYAWGGRSAVTNGLIYAMGSGSYNRPWNTRYKSILGGGKFYYEEYVEPKQNTLYFKKFNVMNGLSSVATHQYMSNVQGAYLEAYRLKKAYDGVDTAITFVIPVYKNMAASYPLAGQSGGGGTNAYISDPDGANVRSGAGTDSSVVMTLGGNTYVDATGSKTGSDGYTWFRISYSDRVGYVRSDLIHVTGWIKDENTGWHYYESDGSILRNGWAVDSVGWMWMDENGNVTKSKWVKANGEWYYLKSNGYMASDEWARDKLGWCWLDSDGKVTKSKWILYNDEWYYLKSNGYMACNEWAEDSKGTVWMDSNGKITRSAWIKEEDDWYYLDDNGYVAKNIWIKDSSGWCWLGSDGKMMTGQWLKYDNKWYYLKNDGHMAVSWMQIGGVNYYFHNTSGYMYSGGTYEIDGKYYTFADNGALQGVVIDTDCEHVWDEGTVTKAPGCETEGEITFTCTYCGKTRTETISATGHEWGAWEITKEPTCVEKGVETRKCVHDPSHAENRDLAPTGIHTWDEGVVTKEATTSEKGVRTYTCTVCGETKTEEIPIKKYGWKVEGGEWHYYDSNGVLVTNGWADDSTGRCWMDANGSITRSYWILCDGEWYYLNDSGYLAVNQWTRDRAGWMWMDSDGKITKSKWIKDGGEWYYLKDNGYMASNEWAKDRLGWMYMASNGKMIRSSWLKLNGYWYYLKDNGYMATGDLTIGGKNYSFDSTGKWIG
jgi:glucan-binding YG repeat protein/beta-N-acetylglucosaminidase